MPKTISRNSLTLHGHNQAHVILSDVHHHGSGDYICQIIIQSKGFSCDTAFVFDNDEYFLAKLKELQSGRNTEAELLDLQSDNYLRIEVVDADTLKVNGLILDATLYTQSLEFAFATGYEQLSGFTSAFEQMLLQQAES